MVNRFDISYVLYVLPVEIARKLCTSCIISRKRANKKGNIFASLVICVAASGKHLTLMCTGGIAVWLGPLLEQKSLQKKFLWKPKKKLPLYPGERNMIRGKGKDYFSRD